MGDSLQPRVWRSGPYRPTSPRTGDEGDTSSFRKNNLITRGRDGHYYESVYSGEGALGQSSAMVKMTGTLALTAGSNAVVGTGTLFNTECPYIGMRISCIPDDNSTNNFIVVQRVVDDTHMFVWVPPHSDPPWPTVSGLVGWLMPRCYSVNDQIGTSTWGNVNKLDRGSIVGAGLGTFLLDGQPLAGTSLTLTRKPTIALFEPVTQTYSVFELGMGQPAPPVLSAVGGGTKGMQGGNYSIVISRGRKQTRGYNNPSERADVTISTNDQIQITFAAMDTSVGQNEWLVWVTTFADTLGADLNYLNGPWHFYIEVDDTMVSSAGGTFNIEYLDAEVENNEIVSFNNDAPTDAMGIESLNTNLIWTSVQGQGFATNPEATSPGPFLSPAKPNNIEAAPLELAISSSPPETIIGTIPGAQGRIYLETTNHLQIAQSTPSDIVPIIIRPLFHSGFATWEQAVFVNGILYMIPVAGPSRSAGDGDESYIEHDWAADVFEITRDWNPGQSLIAHDPKNNMIVLMHVADHLNDAGFWTTRMLGYGLSQGFWVFDRVKSSDTRDEIICGVATVADRLVLISSGRKA